MKFKREAREIQTTLMRLLSRYSPSTIIRRYADKTYTSLVYALAIKVYLDNATRGNFHEAGAPKGSLRKCRARFTETLKAVRSALRLEDHSIDRHAYDRFLEKHKVEFPELGKYRKAVEKIVPSNLPSRLSRAFQHASVKSFRKDTDLDTILERVMVETWIKNQGRLPSSKGDQRKLDRGIRRFLTEGVPKAGRRLADTLTARSRAMLHDEEAVRVGFEGRLRVRWGRAFDLLQCIIRMALETGDAAKERCNREDSMKKVSKRSALFRLHARGIQIANEILTLCRAGFADGALARWRSLHELTVTAFFLADNDEEISERYLAHAAVKSYAEALTLDQHHRRLGYRKVDKRTLARLEAQVKKLNAKYEDEFGGPWKDYNWIPKRIMQKRSFRDLEDYVRISHLRPYYRLASNAVHGGSKGFYQIGLMEGARRRLLLAGPTNYGFADPLQNTGLSLTQLTSCLFQLAASFEAIMSVQAMMVFQGRLAETAMSINRQIEEEERRSKGLFRKRQSGFSTTGASTDAEQDT